MRRNTDKFLNAHGRKIIQLCQSIDLIILNGRSKGDLLGNLTFMNASRGTSTIDYGLCNNNLYNCLENFLVLPLTDLSDHSKIVTIFKNNIPISDVIKDTYQWENMNPRYIWDNNRNHDFCNFLENSTNEIEEIKQRIEGGLIRSTGEKIQDLFIKAANHSCQVKSIQ